MAEKIESISGRGRAFGLLATKITPSQPASQAMVQPGCGGGKIASVSSPTTFSTRCSFHLINHHQQQPCQPALRPSDLYNLLPQSQPSRCCGRNAPRTSEYYHALRQRKWSLELRWNKLALEDKTSTRVLAYLSSSTLVLTLSVTSLTSFLPSPINLDLAHQDPLASTSHP